MRETGFAVEVDLKGSVAFAISSFVGDTIFSGICVFCLASKTTSWTNGILRGKSLGEKDV